MLVDPCLTSLNSSTILDRGLCAQSRSVAHNMHDDRMHELLKLLIVLPLPQEYLCISDGGSDVPAREPIGMSIAIED